MNGTNAVKRYLFNSVIHLQIPSLDSEDTYLRRPQKYTLLNKKRLFPIQLPEEKRRGLKNFVKSFHYF